MNFDDLARTIRAHRLKCGITQKQLAEESGACRMTIVKLESGVTDVRVVKLSAVLDALGLKLAILPNTIK